MKRILSGLLICLSMVIHASDHYPSKQRTTVKVDSADSVNCSLRFRMCWDSIALATDHFRLIDSYKPTQSTIRLFNLNRIEHSYYIKGYLKTRTALSLAVLQDFSGSIVPYSNLYYSYCIPLNRIVDLIHIDSLEYIDLSIETIWMRDNTINKRFK